MTHRHLTALAAVLLLAAAGCGESRPATGSANDCSACHGFPPATLAHSAAPGGTWEASDCSQCHPESIDATGAIIPGGKHANGTVEGGHPLPFTDPALHGPMADAGIATCQACHGDALTGGTPGTTNCTTSTCHTGAIAFTNCTLCHGTRVDAYTEADLPSSAPPADVAGLVDVAEVTVGLHQAHVTAPNNPLGCGDCHAADGTTPADIFATGHIDGGTAEVPFGPLARTGDRAPAWDRTAETCSSTWCHARGGSDPTPSWTTAGTRTCGSCHPDEPTAAAHPAHVSPGDFSDGFNCGTCHPGTGSYANDHLDGALNVVFDNAPVAGGTYAAGTCSSVYCHGTFTGGTNASVEWTGTVACDSCHARPPATGRHGSHVNTYLYGCEACHAGYTTTRASGVITGVTLNATARGLHVDGSKDVTLIVGTWDGVGCTATCHTGTRNW